MPNTVTCVREKSAASWTCVVLKLLWYAILMYVDPVSDELPFTHESVGATWTLPFVEADNIVGEPFRVFFGPRVIDHRFGVLFGLGESPDPSKIILFI